MGGRLEAAPFHQLVLFVDEGTDGGHFLGVRHHRDHDRQFAAGRRAQECTHLGAKQRRAIERHSNRAPADGGIFFLCLAQIGQHLVAADVERAEYHRLVARDVDDGLIGRELPLQTGKRVGQHKLQFSAEQADASCPRFRQMGHVHK